MTDYGPAEITYDVTAGETGLPTDPTTYIIIFTAAGIGVLALILLLGKRR